MIIDSESSTTVEISLKTTCYVREMKLEIKSIHAGNKLTKHNRYIQCNNTLANYIKIKEAIMHYYDNGMIRRKH